MSFHRFIDFSVACRTAQDKLVGAFGNRLVDGQSSHCYGIFMKDLSCSASGAAAPGINSMSVELEQLDSWYAPEDRPGLLDDPDAPA